MPMARKKRASVLKNILIKNGSAPRPGIFSVDKTPRLSPRKIFKKILKNA